MSPVVASRSSLVCKVKFSENYSHGKWFQKSDVRALAFVQLYVPPAPVKVVRKTE